MLAALQSTLRDVKLPVLGLCCEVRVDRIDRFSVPQATATWDRERKEEHRRRVSCVEELVERSRSLGLNAEKNRSRAKEANE